MESYVFSIFFPSSYACLFKQWSSFSIKIHNFLVPTRTIFSRKIYLQISFFLVRSANCMWTIPEMIYLSINYSQLVLLSIIVTELSAFLIFNPIVSRSITFFSLAYHFRKVSKSILLVAKFLCIYFDSVIK